MDEVQLLKNENECLKNKVIELEEKLKKYTAPARNKKYYDNNKESHIKRVKEYKEKTNYVYVPSPEQKKEWARTAYLNKKAKLKKLEEKNEKENI